MPPNVPQTRLRSFLVGSTVKLKGAETTRPLFFAERDNEYGYLYRSKQHFDDGYRWEVMASLGHLAESAS